MSRKKITSNLQMKIRQYLRFIWQEELTQNVDFENEIISKLSKSLKEELFLEANGSILNRYSMFFANFSEQLLRSLMYKMKEVRFNPEDLIFSQNSPDDFEIFFIIKGKVEIFINANNKFEKDERISLRTLEKGAVFGELSFFTGQPRTASAKSNDFSSMIYIKRDEFLSVLEKFPEDYEKYCFIRDQIVLERNFNSINTSCYSCKSLDHLIKDCPLFHYSRFSRHMIKSHFNIQHTKRTTMKRRKLKSHHALLHKNTIQSKTAHFVDIEEFRDSKIKYLEEKGRKSLGYEKSPKINPGIASENRIKTKEESNIPIKGKSPNKNVLNSEMDKVCKIEDFEKIGHFKNYYPEYNAKEFVRKKSQLGSQSPTSQMKSHRMKNKLQTYFLKKEQTFKTQVTTKSSKPKEYVKKKKISSIYTESQSNENYFGRKPKINFFDLVYEVLTNEDLKKKLAAIKGGNLKKKKKN